MRELTTVALQAACPSVDSFSLCISCNPSPPKTQTHIQPAPCLLNKYKEISMRECSLSTRVRRVVSRERRGEYLMSPVCLAIFEGDCQTPCLSA